jgi:diguanylate cyclase (GGDEF)-like protein/hemerythrin-like metal-binding protein
MAEHLKRQPWLVRIHHRLRAVAFAMLFVATVLHLVDQGLPRGLLIPAFLLLLVYPQVQYWRASRSADPIQTELRSLLLDSFLLGAFMAALAFPLWISFAAALGTLTNNAANKGWRGVRHALLALACGALLEMAFGGFHFSPQTGLPATAFCMLGLTGYLLAMNHIGFSRNAQLRRAKKNLQLREQELQAANDSLQQHLREINSLQEQLREQAVRDPLTNLYNRRYLDSTLERDLSRCKRDGQALSLMMIDVDHFKNFNDHYGHLAGDEALKSVARGLQASAKRASDLAARYGGEEFTWVLADTDGATAQRLAEDFRAAIAALQIKHEHSLQGRLTVSIGIATLSNTAYQTVAALTRAADEALYRAKHGGRNQVRLAPIVPRRSGLGNRIPANFVPLVWHRAHECGDLTIDAQHQQLFGDANDILYAMLEAKPREAVAVLFAKLISDATEHFEDEEDILVGSGFAGAVLHMAIHRELAEHADYLLGRYTALEIDGPELFQFLAHDLVARHMLGADRAFFNHIQQTNSVAA